MVWQFLTKLNISLPYSSTVSLLDIYSRGIKTSVPTKTCTWVFMAGLFIIAPNWKQPSCPSPGERINRLGYTHTMGNHSVLQRNTLLTHETPWMTLRGIWLRERNSPRRLHAVWFYLYNMAQKTKLEWWIVGSWLPRMRGGRGCEEKGQKTREFSGR